MPRNPYIYALGAALYIIGIVLTIDALTSFSGPDESILIPITMLGLFVLSAAVMGFLFLYEPFRLYFADRRVEALEYFGKVVATFACLVALSVVLLLFGPF